MGVDEFRGGWKTWMLVYNAEICMACFVFSFGMEMRKMV